MRASTLLPLIFAFVITSFSYMSDAKSWHVCTPCVTDEECDRKPDDFCTYGETRDACNRKTCAKGPGERCGGPMDMLGHCGEGLRCHRLDERCYGCSALTFDCY